MPAPVRTPARVPPQRGRSGRASQRRWPVRPACPLAGAPQSWTQRRLRPRGQMVRAEQGAAWLSTALGGKVGRGSWPMGVPPRSSPKAPGPHDSPGRWSQWGCLVLVPLCPAAESGCWPVRGCVRGAAGTGSAAGCGDFTLPLPPSGSGPQLLPASSQGPLRDTCCPVGPGFYRSARAAPLPWP